MVDVAGGTRARGAQRRDVVAMAELHARGRGNACQLAREKVGVGSFCKASGSEDLALSWRRLVGRRNSERGVAQSSEDSRVCTVAVWGARL
jgi:hypothetical protein